MPTKHTKATYVCDVCHTEHDTKKQAEGCEKMPIEKQSFKVGDQVQATLEKFPCSNCGPYTPAGKVTETVLTGNDGLTQDYINRWLHGTEAQSLLGKKHLWRYVVAYKCPTCSKVGDNMFFAVELQLWKGSKGRKTS